MNALRLNCLLLCLLGHLVSFSQQTPLYSQYFLNPYLYNPAAAGLGGEAKAYFLYRKQWAGVQGAPETQAFTIDGQLKNQRIGLGVSFFNDISNIIGRVNGSLSASYTLDLAPSHRLAFGMSLMAIQNRIFFDRIQTDDITDPNLLTRVDQKTAFEGNVGMMYLFKKMKLGFAVDQVFQNEINHENAAQFQSLDFNYVRHYITTATYDFHLNEDLTLKPLFLVRTVEGLPSQIDVNATLDFRDKVWLSAAYRHRIGVGISTGFEIEERFVLGYTLELPTSDLSILGATSHEIVLGLRLKRKSENQRFPSRIARDNQYLKELRDENAAQYEKLEALEQDQRDKEAKLERYEAIVDRQNEELARLKKTYDSFAGALDSLKSGVGYFPGTSPTPGPEADYYLVVGAFRQLDNAKSFQKIAKRDAGIDTRVIQNNQQTWFLIYTEQLEELSGVEKKIQMLTSGKGRELIIGTPWVFVKEKGHDN